MAGARFVWLVAASLLLAGQATQMSRADLASLWAGVSHRFGARLPAVAAARPPAAQPRLAALATPSGATTQIGPAETIAADRLGQFQARVEIEGTLLPVLIDTGASFVCLTYEDADRLGFRPLPSDFRFGFSTANGRALFARVELREVRLGSIAVDDVAAFVAPRGALSQTLLGMNFLSKVGLRSEAGRLVLRQ